ncbi:MAG TPA: alpha-amylase, partial [Gammaproteobacteria bacterium]|nr:alpha-amylase [Gammaproteobacteria bacterium]
QGDFQILLADDATGVVAYGRKTYNQVAIVIVNRSNTAQAGSIPVAGYLQDGITLNKAYVIGDGGANSVSVTNGEIKISIGALSAVILLSENVDLQPTAAPTNLSITVEGNASISLSWNAVSDANEYTLYRSPVSGGGFAAIATGLTGTDYTDNDLVNGKNYFYVVTSSDLVGNESGYSNEVAALPHLTIGWANLQWPPTMNHTISAINRTESAYGQVWIDGVTNQPGVTPGLLAQLGFGPQGSNPDGNTNWSWTDAAFNVDAGNNDEFIASLLPDTLGAFDYVYRYSTTNGRDWLYADLNGLISSGNLPPNPGKLTVNPGVDLTPPSMPTGLVVSSASPTAISLVWDTHPNTDGDLAGFEVYRDGALYATILGTAVTSYTDTVVVENVTYDYFLIAIDNNYNRSD